VPRSAQWFGLLSFALLAPLALTGCVTLTPQQHCALLIPPGPADAAPNAIPREQRLATCAADKRVESWLACTTGATGYDKLAECARSSGVQFPRARASGSAGRSAFVASTCTPGLPAATLSSSLTRHSGSIAYRPSVWGFRFQNSCPDGKSFNCCQVSPGVSGCCEGMSYGSMDYYLRGQEVPLIAGPATALHDWADLDQWVMARQKEAAWKNWPLYINLTTLTNPLGLPPASLGAWDGIKRSIDAGKPVLVGLMALSGLVWESHAVVAWDYAEDLSAPDNPRRYFWVYDSNYPMSDAVWIEADKNTLIWSEYAYGVVTCPSDQWRAIATLDYIPPGNLAGSRVPDVFTKEKILSTNGAFVQDMTGIQPIGRAEILQARTAFTTFNDIELSALGGSRWNTIPIDIADYPTLRCLRPPGLDPLCRPAAEATFHEIYSGLQAKVRSDGTYCPTTDYGLLVPDHVISFFKLRPECAGNYTPPPVQPGVSGLHRVRVALRNVDDDAYVWLDKAGPNEAAICSAAISTGDASCDVTQRLFGNNAVLVFKLGNHGGFNSKGDFFVEIDGVVAWAGREADAGWKHTGWTYRARVSVDVVNGTAKELGVDSCYNIGDCPD
jgi:hypothetical protein